MSPTLGENNTSTNTNTNTNTNPLNFFGKHVFGGLNFFGKHVFVNIMSNTNPTLGEWVHDCRFACAPF